MKINYSDGSKVTNAVVHIWEDWHTERRGTWYRAFWVNPENPTSGSPVIGYCSPGGSHRTIIACAFEVWRYHHDAEIYRAPRAGGKPRQITTPMHPARKAS